MIPKSFIQQVLEKTRIEELISEYTELKAYGAGLKGTCPFHHDTNSFSVSPGKQIFKCFSCQRGGDTIKFVMLIKKMTYPQAITHLAERLSMELLPSTPTP